MPLKCGACGRFTTSTDGVRCAKCARYIHKACVNISGNAKVTTSWQCPDCKVHTPRRDNTEQPIRDDTVIFGSPRESIESVNLTEQILREVRLHREETKEFREEFIALRDIVSSFQGRLSDVETRLSTLENKICEPQMKVVEGLRSTIEQLKMELNDRDQDFYSNDIEITGIPENKSENVGQILGLIAGKLSVTLEHRDIVSVERMGLRRAHNGESASSPPRHRPLIVRVARRQLREELLKAARVRRGLTTEGMGIDAAHTRFYLNERLTRHNKVLFHKTREEARSHGWKYVWTSGGKIFARRETGTASFRVRTDKDIEKIF